MTFLCYFILAYLWGSIPYAFIIGKYKNIDIKKEGSGNVGASNITRTLGKKWGVLCFILDFLKGLLPVLIIDSCIDDVENINKIIVYLGTITGHLFSIFLKFKGGKGVASSTGALIYLDPISLTLSIITWIIIVKISKYISLASIIASIILPVSCIIQNIINDKSAFNYLVYCFISITIIIILSHTSNIKRLLKGTENKI